MHPKIWTSKYLEVHFIMSKITREQRIEIYVKWQDGESKSSLSEQYNINKSRIEYMVRLVDYHGLDILRKDKNNYYSPALKKEIIDSVLLNNQSIISTAIEFGLPGKGLLSRWIKLYKENGCVIVEKKRGRSSTMTKDNKANKKYKDMTPEG